VRYDCPTRRLIQVLTADNATNPANERKFDTTVPTNTHPVSRKFPFKLLCNQPFTHLRNSSSV
jgi:hypothetical protein